MSNEYDNEFYGYADDDSYASDFAMNKKMRRELAELNRQDKNYFEVKRQVGYKPVTIGIFGSGDVGSSIRDATTGIRNFGHKVGSVYEDLYFKMRICTGELGPNSPNFFFDSPEQYERHMKIKLDDDIRSRWYEKNLAARRALSADDAKALRRELTVLQNSAGENVTVTLVK
jgi:hypothetical protein